MEIRVDHARCASAGMCVVSVPAVFDQSDEDGTVRLITPVPAPELVRAVRIAAQRCPSGAITLHDVERTPMTGDEALAGVEETLGSPQKSAPGAVTPR